VETVCTLFVLIPQQHISPLKTNSDKPFVLLLFFFGEGFYEGCGAGWMEPENTESDAFVRVGKKDG